MRDMVKDGSNGEGFYGRLSKRHTCLKKRILKVTFESGTGMLLMDFIRPEGHWQPVPRCG